MPSSSWIVTRTSGGTSDPQCLSAGFRTQMSLGFAHERRPRRFAVAAAVQLLNYRNVGGLIRYLRKLNTDCVASRQIAVLSSLLECTCGQLQKANCGISSTRPRQHLQVGSARGGVETHKAWKRVGYGSAVYTG